MSTLVFAAVLIGTTAYLIFGPLRRAFAILVGATFLVPAQLLIRSGASAYLSVHRVLLLAFVVNLIIRVRRHEVVPDALRPTGVHAALITYAVVTLVTGVVLGELAVPPTIALYTWLFVIDQLITFAVALAMIRWTRDPVWFARVLAAVAVIVAAVAVGERITHSSYAAWLFQHTGQSGSPSNFGLELRDGNLRVRAAANFSLSYAWNAAILLPLVMATYARGRRWLAYLFPGALAVSILWTHSRSAYIGALIVVVVLALGSRLDIPVTKIVVVGGITALALVLFTPGVGETFSGSSGQGSTHVREARLPIVLRDAAQRPFIGLGLAAAGYHFGISSTDAAYLGTYAESGVVGVGLLILVLLVTFFSVLPALRGPPGIQRVLGAAAVAGILGSILAAAAYDEYSESAAYRLLWLLAALGVYLAERVREGEPRQRRIWAVRAPLPIVGCLIGLAVFSGAQRFGSVTYRFDAIGPGADAAIPGSADFASRTLVETACEIMETGAKQVPGTVVSCYDLQTGTGLGEVRIQAGTEKEASQRANVLLGQAGTAVRGSSAYLLETADGARRTWARTAPLWMGLLGFGLAILPPFRRRRAGRKSTHAGRSYKEPSFEPALNR